MTVHVNFKVWGSRARECAFDIHWTRKTQMKNNNRFGKIYYEKCVQIHDWLIRQSTPEQLLENRNM